MNCYSCDAPAINVCKRCARPYCDDHGNAQYCADCLKPASALPSFNLYRGSLLVMLVGTAVAIVLIMRPPGETKGASPVIVGRSSPTATAASGTPSNAGTPEVTPSAASGNETPGAQTTPGTETPGTGTPAASTATPASAVTPAPSATSSPFNEYVVQDGDSVASIAEAMLAPGDDLTAFENAIIALNNLDAANPILQPGQKLLLPKPRTP